MSADEHLQPAQFGKRFSTAAEDGAKLKAHFDALAKDTEFQAAVKEMLGKSETPARVVRKRRASIRTVK